jgi:tellurite methyltransferase
MRPGGGDWVGYYEEQGDRTPRDLLLQVLGLFEAEDRRGSAVDIGCGQGFDTDELLRRGWEVVAIDATEEGIERLRRRVPDEHAARLRTLVSPMEYAELPAADLLYASFSLPYCPPDAFPRFWADLRTAIRPNGRFAGQLFGDRDTWASTEPQMTFFDAARARGLFDGLDVESFAEEEEDDEDMQKHWHVFHVIAKQPS